MDKIYDVVVVGYGGAGAVSAITAYDNGASVLILEKMPSGGGNTRVSGGNVAIPKSMELANYLDTLCFKNTEREIIDVYVENAMKIGDWIREMGGDYTLYAPLRVAYPMTSGGASFPQVAGAQHMVKYNIKGSEAEGTPGQCVWDLFSSCVEKRGIEVMTNTPAKELVKNQKGEVVGVIAEIEGKDDLIKAKKGVILTCGGFENNAALKWDYLPLKPVQFLGSPGNTGDGISMVQKAGAGLWHMPSLSCGIGLKVPEYEAAFFVSFLSPRFILVDKHGRRFIDEASMEPHEYWRTVSYFDTNRIEYPRIPSYAVFDKEVLQRGAITMGTAGFNRDTYQWSEDNSAEVSKGWIIKAKKISELAKRLSMDESVLENTISKYNQYCQNGQDLEWGRAKQDLMSIEKPYYAVELWPALINTQGGPRRDKESRVLDPDGKPITGLYAAGEFGSIWGFLYQGAVNIAECIVFGQIAGRNAADSPEVGL